VPSGLSKRRREWEDLAAVDPYWGVLTHPQAKHGGWDQSAFFASGQQAVEELLKTADQFEVPRHRAAVLDFGCGLGRLTRALAHRFDQAHGLDVSESLIGQARELNHDVPNCEFRVLDGDGLAEFESESIDLVCSLLVLQHQARRKAIRGYIAEFVRVLRPGGLLVFQLPTHIPVRHRVQPRRRAYWALRALGLSPSTLYNRLGLDPLRMRHMAPGDVAEAVTRGGGRLVTALEDNLAGSLPSATYYVTRDR
jgi:SAM-dependent methyltransferase